MKFSKKQKQYLPLGLLVIALLALFIVFNPLNLSISEFSGALEASQLIKLDKTNYSYSEPIEISLIVNPDPQFFKSSNCNFHAMTYNYLQGVSLSDFYIVIDGQQINTPSADLSNQPFSLIDGQCTKTDSYYEQGYFNQASYTCIYNPIDTKSYDVIKNGQLIFTPAPTNFIDFNKNIMTIKLSQSITPGTHIMNLYWKGTIGGIAASSCSDGTLNYLGRFGSSGALSENLYATKTFNIISPPSDTPNTTTVSEMEACGPGQIIAIDGSCLVPSTPTVAQQVLFNTTNVTNTYVTYNVYNTYYQNATEVPIIQSTTKLSQEQIIMIAAIIIILSVTSFVLINKKK